MIAKQPRRIWHVIKERCSVDQIADMARDHKEAQGEPIRIGDGMELVVHAAIAAADPSVSQPGGMWALELHPPS